MKSKQKGLQKFTDTEAKIKKILALEVITYEDLKTLSKEEQSLLFQQIGKDANGLKGKDKEQYLNKIDAIISEETKNSIWEHNHNQITQVMSNSMQEYGRMPSKTEIANKTGLSRQTVYKHLKEYATHSLYLEQVEQFQFMTSKVLAKVFKFAVNGDIGAAKLYLSAMGNIKTQPSNNTLIQTQNNYIQINGRVLSQETIKQLNPEQLKNIEAILKSALPQP